MPFATHSETVAADFDTVWRFLLTKVERPESFVPGVRSSEILERNPDSWLRRMQSDDLEVTERITADREAGCVRFELVEHPKYAGHVDNLVEASDDGVVLTFVLEWELKSEGDLQEDMGPAIREAVQRTKVQAEEATTSGDASV